MLGDLESMVDETGRKTTYKYLPGGLLETIIYPEKTTERYTYDERDNLIGVFQYGKKGQRERECHITRYERDLLGRVKTIVDPLGLKEHYVYDSKGQLVEKLDKEGYLTRYGYTSQGDISNIQYADGREVKLSYNPLCQLQEIKDWLGTTKFESDLLGRATEVLYPDDKKVSYTYGKGGRRTSITYPDEKTVYYKYDKDFRLSQLKEGDKVINYNYDRSGRLIKKIFPNHIETAYQYNAKGQIEQLVHTDHKGIIDKYVYQYDLSGNRTGITRERRGLPEESGRYTYTYDAIGRISSVARNEKLLRTYVYDSYGNRTKLTEKGRETAYKYNVVNQLQLKLDSHGETEYTFDKRGNQTLYRLICGM